MQTLITIINANWFWFGPVIMAGSFVALAWVVRQLWIERHKTW